MQQIYHSNARTNVNNRQQIQKSACVSNQELASRFNVSSQTVSKWRNRDFVQDASCCPVNIQYALSELETALIISIRSCSWLPLDEVYETLLEQNPLISRSFGLPVFSKKQNK